MRRVVAALLLLLVVPAALSLGRLDVDNRLERWVGDDPAGTDAYRRFRATFGSDEFVLVAVAGADLLSAESLDLRVEAVGAVEGLDGVIRVMGPAVVFRDLFGGEDPEALADELTSTPFYRHLFISDDGLVLGTVVVVEPGRRADARRRLVRGIEEAYEPVRQAGMRVELVGPTVLAAALDRVSEEEALRTLPLALLGSLVVLALLLRSLRGMAVAATCAGVSVVLTLSLVVASGRSLSMVSSALPSLVWVLSLAGAIHVLRRYQDFHLGASAPAAMREALGETTRPCTIAAVTTSLGFLSLLAATLSPVRELGVFVAGGLMIGLVAALTVAPVAAVWLRVPARGARHGFRLERLVRWTTRRHRAVLAVFVVVAAVAGASVPFLPVDANPLRFLPRDNPTVEAYRWVGENLTGFHTLEVVVDTPAPWWTSSVSSRLDRLQETFAGMAGVARVLSPLDLLRKLHQWDVGPREEAYRLPAEPSAAEKLVREASGPAGELLDAFSTADGDTVRLSLVVDVMDEGAFLDLVEQVRAAVGKQPAGWTATVTGQVLRLVEAQDTLVSTQVRSFGAALVVVLTAIGVGLRSIRLAALSVVPNMAPILVVLATMAWARIPLDAATVMVASVSLGIAVDDSVHLLEGYRRRRDALGISPALCATATDVGPALVVTTATACVGFFSLLPSRFVPVARFGLLAGLAMLAAFVAAVVVVPAVVTAFAGKGARL